MSVTEKTNDGKFAKPKPFNIKELDAFDVDMFMHAREKIDEFPVGQREAVLNMVTKSFAEASQRNLHIALEEACKLGIISITEYEKDWKGRYSDEDGLDSFGDLLTAVINKGFYGKNVKPVFVTTNQKLQAIKVLVGMLNAIGRRKA